MGIHLKENKKTEKFVIVVFASIFAKSLRIDQLQTIFLKENEKCEAPCFKHYRLERREEADQLTSIHFPPRPDYPTTMYFVDKIFY